MYYYCLPFDTHFGRAASNAFHLRMVDCAREANSATLSGLPTSFPFLVSYLRADGFKAVASLRKFLRSNLSKEILFELHERTFGSALRSISVLIPRYRYKELVRDRDGDSIFVNYPTWKEKENLEFLRDFSREIFILSCENNLATDILLCFLNKARINYAQLMYISFSFLMRSPNLFRGMCAWWILKMLQFF